MSISASYILVAAGILMAKGIGFFREILFASVFGATEYTDIYFQIFSLASLLFTGIGSALSTLVIKNLNKRECAVKEKEYVSYFICKTALCIILVLILLYTFSLPIVKVLLPGLRADLYSDAVKILHIMLPSCLFVSVAYIMSGVLQNNKVFFITSIMSLPYNIAIIFSLFSKNIDIIKLSYVTTFGWFLHIVFLMPSFYKKGYRFINFNKTFDFKNGRAPEIIYIFISGMMFQLCFMMDKAAVSFDSGAASTINYASNLFVTIASVFVVAVSNVTYPSVCKCYENGENAFLKEIMQYLMTLLFVIIVPFILTAVCFGRDIISLLYERGEFTSELTRETAILFAVYTLGIFGYICQELFNKVLYLASEYKYTFIGSLAVIILKPILNKIVVTYFGINASIGVAAATTCLFVFYAINIAFAIKREIGSFVDKNLTIKLAKVLLSGVAAFVLFLVLKAVHFEIPGSRLTFLVELILCAAVYAGTITLTGVTGFILKKQPLDRKADGGIK